MTTFFLDLWQDLRAKRLWPIAVALLAATIAVPALLFKPAASTAPSNGSGQASGAAKLPTVALDASSIASSHLNVFKEKNPFDTLADPSVVAAGTNGGTAGSSTGGSVGSSVAGGASTGSGSSTGGSGGGSTTPPVGPDGKPITPGVHYFTFTADVRFGPRTDVKTYKSVNELDVLPDGKTPVVAFMGVKNGDTAMFFIADPAFRAEGEGECQPAPDNCMFLYLKADSGHDEETLSAQSGQVEYVLQLKALHIKSLSESQAVGSTTPDSGKGAAKKVKAGVKKAKLRAKEHATLLSMPALGLATR